MRDFQLPGRSPLYVSNAICATSHPVAAKVAIDILEAGGNAVDAAIAGAVLLGLGEPAMTGIGGDMFALVKPAGSETVIGMNASGRAPKGVSADALRAKGWSAMDVNDANSIVVPGAIRGFERLAADHGRLGLDRLLAPTIRYAEEGLRVVPRAAFDWARGEPRMRGAMRRHYLHGDRPLREGDLFRHPGQAEVLRRIAKDGSRAFYEGEVAEDMVSSLNALGAAHTMEDFAACEAVYVDPVAGTYRGAELIELPPNGHGATAILMAQILGHFDVAALDPLGADRAHLEIEAAKLAYAARNEVIADPDHMTYRIEDFVSPRLAAEFAARIDRTRAMAWPTDPIGHPHKDTIYITVVDRDRMAVSLIYSVYHDFGSCLASEKFGINFNNRAAGFVLTKGHPNEIAGGKRPMHTIIPGMLKRDGRVVMPFGVMGGAYQPHGHVRLVSNILDFGMDVQAAQDAPRLFHQDGVVGIERGYAREVWTALEAMGHRTGPREVAIGGSQAIWIDHERGLLIGGTDPRKDGVAHGY
ncbi:gamma-glutamyltransferase family protein [Limibaculum sp. FT325]|uniref:gamma-glutamyltransferase family protein n=1 Tax=Thermohalobaculum sediminis TaxID=2939436 RepID=UPI0020BD992F|nr:gamma-glutamyltransferase family protein [Limibaculum sediminis]MCL5776965.1 gamma-glutamyltransferase family protein [Limibaculum sediminis]